MQKLDFYGRKTVEQLSREKTASAWGGILTSPWSGWAQSISDDYLTTRYLHILHLG